MKRILIIGAGYLQTFIIKKAKALGYYVIAVDANPNSEGFKFCDEYKVVDIVNEKACLEYATEMKIDGVLTAATDYGVLSMAYIAEKLNLPGINYESAKCIKNKYMVRQRLSLSGADDTGKCYQISDCKEIGAIRDKIQYPVMVKPCDGSGSRGASRVDDGEFLEQACRYALDSSLSCKALIEPFIAGKEYGAESFVYNGEIYVLGIMKKHMTSLPYCAELGHCIPSELSTETENKAKECVKKAIKALGINHGSVNMDILITNEGNVHIVDIGARMGGNLIGTHIIPLATGVLYPENMIKAAVGDKADFECANEKSAVATRLLALTPGVIDKLPNFNEIETKYNVKIEHHLKEGDLINEYRTNLDGCGYVVAAASDITTADANAQKALKEIDLSIIRK